MLLTAVSILIQFPPLRIDHHAMQIIAGATAVLAIVGTGRDDGHRGLIAGIAMACWPTVSFVASPMR